MPETTVFFSRFPDTATADAEPLVVVPEVVTICLRTLSVRRWAWDDGAKEFVECIVVLVADVDVAMAYVPPALEEVPVPEHLRLLAFVTPARAV